MCQCPQCARKGGCDDVAQVRAWYVDGQRRICMDCWRWTWVKPRIEHDKRRK